MQTGGIFISSSFKQHRMDYKNHWSKSYSHFITVSQDRNSLFYSGTGSPFSVGSAIAAKPLPTDRRVAYFEVDIEQTGAGCAVVVGLCDRSHCSSKDVGSEPWYVFSVPCCRSHSSFGYSGASGHVHSSGVRANATYASFCHGDTVGCGVDYSDSTVFFTRNGSLIGRFEKLPHGPIPMYPAVSMSSRGDGVKANFAGPFRFDPRMISSAAISREQDDIRDIVVPCITDVVRGILVNYLYTKGYPRTLEKFMSRFDLESPGSTCLFRSRVATLIRAGQIEEALRGIDSVYPAYSMTSQSPALVLLLTQQVYELLSSGDDIGALRFLKQNLARFRFLENCEIYDKVTDVCTLFCSEGPVSVDLATRRKEVASAMNRELLKLAGEDAESQLEERIRGVVACRVVARDENGKRGQLPFPRMAYTRPTELGRLEPRTSDKSTETDSL